MTQLHFDKPTIYYASLLFNSIASLVALYGDCTNAAAFNTEAQNNLDKRASSPPKEEAFHLYPY